MSCWNCPATRLSRNALRIGWRSHPASRQDKDLTIMSEQEQPSAAFRIAVVQMNPQRSERKVNRNAILERIAQAAQAGAKLVVFPECALSGYVFDSAAEAI